jgi:hypothetical protein
VGFLSCPSYKLRKGRVCSSNTVDLTDLTKTHSTVPREVTEDTWEWAKGHKEAIPKWAMSLVPVEYHCSDYVGQTFHCSFGRSKSVHRLNEKPACPWIKYVLFPLSMCDGKVFPKPSEGVLMVYKGKNGEGQISFDISDHATWKPDIHPQRVIAPLTMRKDWIEHCQKSNHLPPSQVIHTFQSSVLDSDLPGNEKTSLIREVATPKTTNALKYKQRKEKSFDVAFKCSDISRIVTNNYTGNVSFKESINDDGPTIFVEMLSKKLIPMANQTEGLVMIDGLFKLTPSLQLVILGVSAPGQYFYLLFFFSLKSKDR